MYARNAASRFENGSSRRKIGGAMNEPSSTVSVRSLTATRPPKSFVRCSRRISATRLPLDRAEGEPAHQVALDREAEDRRRHDQDHREGGLVPVLLPRGARLQG